jgi:hypothetical protein
MKIQYYFNQTQYGQAFQKNQVTKIRPLYPRQEAKRLKNQVFCMVVPSINITAYNNN